MVANASGVHRQVGRLDDRRPCPIFQIHENHEYAIQDFAMRHVHPLSKINTVPADSLPVQQSATCGLTKQEKHMTWEKPTACDMRFGFEITMYIANR
jgi:coenzyme PQQ precursor peptide PqqA